MNRYFFSSQALTDLRTIWDYIAVEQDNPDAANRQIARFFDKFALLASQPLMGQLRNDLRPNLRIFTADSYVILYYPSDSGHQNHRPCSCRPAHRVAFSG